MQNRTLCVFLGVTDVILQNVLKVHPLCSMRQDSLSLIKAECDSIIHIYVLLFILPSVRGHLGRSCLWVAVRGGAAANPSVHISL